jgi:hypothetical protein
LLEAEPEKAHIIFKSKSGVRASRRSARDVPPKYHANATTFERRDASPLNSRAYTARSLRAFAQLNFYCEDMSMHRFKIGQHVRISAGAGMPLKNGPYKIVALLPPTEGSNQYRVRSAAEPHDRVVAERALAHSEVMS